MSELTNLQMKDNDNHSNLIMSKIPIDGRSMSIPKEKRWLPDELAEMLPDIPDHLYYSINVCYEYVWVIDTHWEKCSRRNGYRIYIQTYNPQNDEYRTTEQLPETFAYKLLQHLKIA